ncbi:hypothetical protein CRG98_019703, partial [Punica granatum]
GFAIPKEFRSKVVDFTFNGIPAQLRHGVVVIAAITSCTNTSNVKPWIKTSLAPGSGVVTKYLEKSDLQKYLNRLGFYTVGYGCTTCIGNSGDLDEAVASAITENEKNSRLVWNFISRYRGSSCIVRNRNFEGRIHLLTRANYLASPLLVVAYALAGTALDIDFASEPLGWAKDGKKVYLHDIWPTNNEIADVKHSHVLPALFRSTYEVITKGKAMWNELPVSSGTIYMWDLASTYIHKPPYFDGMIMSPPGAHSVRDAYCLLFFGDSVTTDHISPSGSIYKDSPAASRRGNGEVVAGGTFANIRIVNKLVDGEVGPFTIHIPSGEKMLVYNAAMRYKSEGQDTIVLAGADYGSGSSRDGAAKGPVLLGVKAVIVKSIEHIHRSNLVGMGIIPLCFKQGEDAKMLGLMGHEKYTIELPSNINEIKPGQDVKVVVDSNNSFTCTLRFDTEVSELLSGPL